MSEQDQIKILFQKAFIQLTQGCRRQFCINYYCGAYRFGLKKQGNDAAKYLLELFKKHNPVSFSHEVFIYCDDKIEQYTAAQLLDMEDQQFAEKMLDIQILQQSIWKDCISEESSGIEFKMVPKIYQRVQSLINQGVIQQDFIHNLLQQECYNQAFRPRGLAILLLYPGFYEMENFNSFNQLCRVISINNLCQKAIQKYLFELNEQMLKDLVFVFQQYLSISVINQLFVADITLLINCLRVFDIIFKSNESHPRIPFTEFYNDAINKEIDIPQEFKIWLRKRQNPDFNAFSIIQYPWIIDSGNKSQLLNIENHYRKGEFARESFLQSLLHGERVSPFTVIQVNRENLIQDTLNQLVSGNLNLQKTLKIVFIGEEAVDEGGPSKEFFSLITQQLFDPGYTMFIYYEGQRLFWFNPNTLEPNINFELIGMILGLAIYNNVTLDINFPMALYKKLQGVPCDMEDLAEFQPETVNGLQQLLDLPHFEEEDLCRTFTVDTQQFGEIISIELKEDGKNQYVNMSNRDEYVRLFVDWWLNSGIMQQFEAFKRGFLRVCDGYMLKLFKYQELEKLICGSRILDFQQLERVTLYDGYTAESPTIKYFWNVIHSLTEEEKKKFLQFCTGSDRAPINGLGSMRFIIQRNGPDSDRLLTSHTCFNHLLLPEYSSETKMRKMIITAINNAQGFGLR